MGMAAKYSALCFAESHLGNCSHAANRLGAIARGCGCDALVRRRCDEDERRMDHGLSWYAQRRPIHAADGASPRPADLLHRCNPGRIFSQLGILAGRALVDGERRATPVGASARGSIFAVLDLLLRGILYARG